MIVRGKFTVDSIKQVSWSKDIRVVHLCGQYDTSIPEDQRYAKATPSASVEMTIDNPAAAAQFELGKAYYVDFTPAEHPSDSESKG